MPQWKQSLNIRPIIEQGKDLDEYDDLPDKTRADMKAELEKVLPNLRDSTYTDLVEELEEFASVADFNEWFDRLYDWSDMKRIWLGAM